MRRSSFVGAAFFIPLLVGILGGCGSRGTSKIAPDPVSGQPDRSIGAIDSAGEVLAEALPERFEYSQRHMGVLARLVLYAPGEPEAMAAARAAFARLAELDSILSDYRVDSELNRLTNATYGRPVPVGADLFEVLQLAQHLAELSGGAFDVTVGPMVLLWREARGAGVLPDPDRLAGARARSGWRNLRLDPVRRTATLLTPEMRLDLGGIAKGYAADEVIATLRDRGLVHALVQLGGDIVVGAPPPGADGWDIPVVGADPGMESVRLAHAAVSTSGGTDQFIVVDGVRYSHVLDPRTGLGLTHEDLATVVAPTGMLSDALSTLASILGADEATALIAAHFPEASVYVRPAPGLPPSSANPLEWPRGAADLQSAE